MRSSSNSTSSSSTTRFLSHDGRTRGTAADITGVHIMTATPGLVRTLGDLRFEYDRVIAKDDFVWVNSRHTRSASPAALIAVDILRIEDGKLVEHWDVLQNEATRGESAGGYPMFGDTFAGERCCATIL
ncbi:nuclear transport factor 2 family protein [Burkholderia ubonensis]|uniref:nuclear transport factor 2 family protein n=1 Tax=Burkholderia ubonensis TaxID=101571 RepID=UPI001E41222D|nr:nuclear transport factor 2 family protein [Burkholderia ubonensis]